MRFVLKLCGWYPSRVDSLSGDFVQRHAMAIATQVKTVVLFAQKDPALNGWKYELEKRVNGNLHEYIYYYPQTKIADKLWSQFYYLRILKDFTGKLLTEHGEPGLVHVNIVWRAAIWGFYLFKKYGWPFVITENSTEYQDNALENIRTKGFFRKRITRNAFRSCKHFIPVSHQLGNKIRELYGDIDYSVVPNCVDVTVFNDEDLKPAGQVFRMLHVSTMGYQKNIDAIIRVITAFSKKDISFELTLAGPADNVVKQMVASIPSLKKQVRFTGAISYKDVAALMKQSDCLLLFSRYENLPCVILEALCCGVPVISTDVGGIPEILDASNGILVKAGDEAGLQKAIEEMALKKVSFDCHQISMKAKQLYNYETVGKSFVKIYEQLFPGKFNP